jgi:hypothetical protein
VVSSLAKFLAGWILPHALYKHLQERARAVTTPEQVDAERIRAARLELAAANRAILGRHKGARCFVLANGPSVKRQDLSGLEGECVISVASGYHHPMYDQLRPRYHCVPQISYVKLTEQDVIAWFREMHSRLGDAELFMSATEEPLVRRHGLFAGRIIRYIFLDGDFESLGGAMPDISGATPAVQSVPIMCIAVAMYMGFRQIYLLGTDHDSFLTGEYKYFYEPTVLRDKDFSVDAAGRVVTSRFEDFHGLARLWRQYRALRQIGEANGVAIFNATAGGALDEFERVPLGSIVRQR